jgi:hypothetical protein
VPVRRSPVLSTLGFLLAPVGLILLATQVVRVVGYDATLNTLGTVLVWAGVGALAVGLLLLALTVTDDATPYAAPAATETDTDTDTTVPPAGTRADDPADSEPARPVHTEPAPVTPAAATPAAAPAPATAEPAAPAPPEGTSSLERLRRHATADEPAEIQHVPEGGGYAGPVDSEPADPSAE